MKILEIQEDKIKFNSLKENEILINTFLQQSLIDLENIGIYSFFNIEEDKKRYALYKRYIECKIKKLMWVESDCFDRGLTEFYVKNILFYFLELIGQDGVLKTISDFSNIMEIIDLNSYFTTFVRDNKDLLNFTLQKVKLNVDKLNFKVINGFVISDSGTNEIYVYKYRLPLKLFLLNTYNLWENLFKLNGYDKKVNSIDNVLNFLISKIDLTKDIQEIQV